MRRCNSARRAPSSKQTKPKIRARKPAAARRSNPAMTKVEAVRIFRKEVVPYVVSKYGRDAAAMRQAWHEFTDMLHRDRRITAHQYETWTSPVTTTRPAKRRRSSR